MRTVHGLLDKFILLFLLFIFLGSICYSENTKSEMLVFDNFEYWTSPHSYGWHTSDPYFPVFGYGIGYGMMRTVLNLKEGSRVLNDNHFRLTYIPREELTTQVTQDEIIVNLGRGYQDGAWHLVVRNNV